MYEKIKTLQMSQSNGCRVTSSQTFGERRTINNEIDEYCAEYKDIFKEVRSYECFKYLH